MLNEVALRKPGFTEGAAVVLGDGQEWHLPRIAATFFPAQTLDGKFSTRVRLTYGRAFDDAFAEAYRADVEADEEAVIAARMNLVCGLLRKNYNLDGDALAELLAIRTDEPETISMWLAVVETVVDQARVVNDEPAPAAAE
ncbi:MAG: hypothetical protein P4L85_19530 [Paludisphaera borealis]|uniref:hypothetical protein n=1 Tax=Paludisphaera borealis TaxID=1387353 RepID=UPI00283ACF57|nr:hypothetical protein [Paludisphaera borealis]MDR3621552.1 hypothetical protein [Paludisphaera borealis]